MERYGTHQYICADLLTDILASGRASRFYRSLLMGDSGLFTSADASIAGTEEPGYLMVSGRLRSDSPEALAEAEQMLDRELTRIREELPTAEELLRAQNRFESNYLFNQLNALDKARNLAMAVMHGENPDDTVARYRAVTPADIRQAANEILRSESSSTLIILPEK